MTGPLRLLAWFVAALVPVGLVMAGIALVTGHLLPGVTMLVNSATCALSAVSLFRSARTLDEVRR